MVWHWRSTSAQMIMAADACRRSCFRPCKKGVFQHLWRELRRQGIKRGKVTGAAAEADASYVQIYVRSSIYARSSRLTLWRSRKLSAVIRPRFCVESSVMTASLPSCMRIEPPFISLPLTPMQQRAPTCLNAPTSHTIPSAFSSGNTLMYPGRSSCTSSRGGFMSGWASLGVNQRTGRPRRRIIITSPVILTRCGPSCKKTPGLCPSARKRLKTCAKWAQPRE